jgi:hypothetical protein
VAPNTKDTGAAMEKWVFVVVIVSVISLTVAEVAKHYFGHGCLVAYAGSSRSQEEIERICRK